MLSWLKKKFMPEKAVTYINPKGSYVELWGGWAVIEKAPPILNVIVSHEEVEGTTLKQVLINKGVPAIYFSQSRGGNVDRLGTRIGANKQLSFHQWQRLDDYTWRMYVKDEDDVLQILGDDLPSSDTDTAVAAATPIFQKIRSNHGIRN